VEAALAATYELGPEIGRGGMGIVYRARDRRLKRQVAIKLLPPEVAFRRDVRSRFLREAETAAQLGHPHIVPIYAVDEVGNLVFFVMAYVEGDNLARRLATRGPLPIAEVRRSMQEVGDALAYAHARGVVHRDIKPDNILLDGIDGRAIVTDFGIARAASESGDLSRLTATGMAIGTPAYMSPEQASGDRDLDARSDLYSLGIVAYQMLCGEPPFSGLATPALLVKHLAEAPVPIDRRRADVPPDLAAIVMRLLEKQPEHRFQSATELVQAVKSGIVPPSPRSGTGAIIAGPLAGGGRPAAPAAPAYRAPAYTERTQQQTIGSPPPIPPVPQATPPQAAAPVAISGDAYVPTAEDLSRWEHPRVAKFRRQFATYLFVNVPLVLINLLSRADLGGVTGIWTLAMAFQYAKVWSDGFDWHDVLRQPRDRHFGEVLSDLWDNIEATFSRRRREELRALGRLRTGLDGALRPAPTAPAFPGAGAAPGPARTGGAVAGFGVWQDAVQAAREERDEIVRIVATLPPQERRTLPDLPASANQLVATIERVAADLAVRTPAPEEALAQVVREISDLEAAANPYDASGSEQRVRRLAQLRRDRRQLGEACELVATRRRQLEECRLTLESMRLDLVRLRTGGSSVQGVTQLAEQAVAMAREVDILVQAAREVQAVGSAPPPASPGAAR
jgi:serine/threonine-protein kinase